MIFDKIKQFCIDCGVDDIDNFLGQCIALKSLLERENEKHNLTRISSDDDFWNKHVADSLSLGLGFTDVRREKLIVADVGCGAGFPSLVLAIAFPNLTITGIDSIKKKTSFVQKAIDQLKLKNLSVKWARSRELGDEWCGKYDIVVARAVAETAKVFKETRMLLNCTGRVILYKGPEKIEEELDQARRQSKKYKFHWETSEPFSLPGGDKRVFIYGKKKKI